MFGFEPRHLRALPEVAAVLTALEKEIGGESRERDCNSAIGLSPARVGFEPTSPVQMTGAFSEVTARSLPLKRFLGENQTRKRPEPASTIARRPRLP